MKSFQWRTRSRNGRAIALTLLIAALGALCSPAAVLSVTSLLDAGEGTLRAVLEGAAPGDVIVFDPNVFPVSDPTTIELATPLPIIKQGGITIDARNAGVVLDGARLQPDATLLVLASDGNTIQGVEFVNCAGTAIAMRAGASENVIGGTGLTDSELNREACVIRNCGTGILIDEEGTGYNTIAGTFIGTARTGQGSFGNGYGVLIASGAGHNTIGPANMIAYSKTIGIEIRGSPANTIGPDNTLVQDQLPVIRMKGGDSVENIITQNVLITAGRVGGFDAEVDATCEAAGKCLYSGAFDIQKTSQGGLRPPRITTIDSASGAVSGTTCPGCAVEVFSGGATTPYIYQGVAWADGSGAFTFEKGSAFSGERVFLTATDARLGTSAVRSPLCSDEHFPIPRQEGEIRVMSYNIQGYPLGNRYDYLWWNELPAGAWYDASSQWSDFVELIEYAQPDVVAFQEAKGLADERVTREFARRLGYAYCAVDCCTGPEFSASSNLAVFSRYEIVDWRPVSTVAGCLWVELRLPSGELLNVLDVHIRPCSEKRYADWLPKLLDEIGAYTSLPTVLLGDFNATLTSSWSRECFRAVPDKDWQLVADNWGTWGTQAPYDSIWVSPMLVSYAHETMAALECAMGLGYHMSDHTPVMMVLSTPWAE